MQQVDLQKPFCRDASRRSFDYFWAGDWRYDDVSCRSLCGYGAGAGGAGGCLESGDLFMKLSSSELFLPTYVDEAFTLRGAARA